MKTLSIVGALLLFGATVNAQDLKTEEVPNNIKTAFSEAYSNASDVEWEKKAELFKVEFEVNRLDHEIWYSADGKIVKTENEIETNQLPSVISGAVLGKYADYKISNVEVTDEGGKKTYEVEISKGLMKERNLKLDANGTILSDNED